MASLILALGAALQKCLCGDSSAQQPGQGGHGQPQQQQGGYPAGVAQPQFQYVPGQGAGQGQGQAGAYPPQQGMGMNAGHQQGHQQGHGQGHGKWDGHNTAIQGGHGGKRPNQNQGQGHHQNQQHRPIEHQQTGHSSTQPQPLGEAASFLGGNSSSHGYPGGAGGHAGNYHAGGPGKENRPPGGYVGASPIGPYHGQDDNQINQSNSQYTALRASAREAGDRAHALFAQSQAAYQAGDGAAAHELSERGKAEMRRKEELDGQAEGWIFKANNEDSPPGTVDLHGLYVKEALEKTEEAITQAQREGRDELRVIVGKGIHSQGHVAKIKPAVEDLMRKYNLSAHVDPHNAGVLVVDLDGKPGNGRTRDAGGLVDQMREGLGGDKDEDACVIM